MIREFPAVPRGPAVFPQFSTLEDDRLENFDGYLLTMIRSIEKVPSPGDIM